MFSSIPLLRAELIVEFSTIMAHTLKSANDILFALQDNNVVLYNEYAVLSPRNLDVKLPRPMALSEIPMAFPEFGVVCRVQEQLISVSWRKESNVPYPGYQKLREITFRVIDALTAEFGEVVPSVVQCHYYTTTDASSKLTPIDWALDKSIFSHAMSITGEPLTFAASFRVPNCGIEYLVDIKRIERESEWDKLLIQTVSAIGPVRDLSSDIDACHEHSNMMFTKLISDEAKAQWGLEIE